MTTNRGVSQKKVRYGRIELNHEQTETQSATAD